MAGARARAGHRCAIRARSAHLFPGRRSFRHPRHLRVPGGRGHQYAIRLPANQVFQNRIGYLLKRAVGRPPNEVRRFFATSPIGRQAGISRAGDRQVQWYPGELYPRVGFIVTNLSALPSASSPSITSAARASSGSRKAKRDQVDAAVMPTFAANAVRLQLHALA